MTTIDLQYNFEFMDDITGFDEFTSALDRRAQILVRNDALFLAQLIELRKRLGLTQAEIAERMNVSQPAVAAFERVENDPKLSTIRRYAMAVGLLVDHVVEVDEGDTFHVTFTTGNSESGSIGASDTATHYTLELSYA